MPSGFQIREMTLADLGGVMMVDALSLPAPWSEGVWRAEIAGALSLYLVAESGGEIIAQIGTKRILEELHITTISVLPQHRRGGAGSSLIRAAVRLAPETKNVLLEVREGNLAAQAFYEKLGFVRCGVRPLYYGDEDAVIMRLGLQR